MPPADEPSSNLKAFRVQVDEGHDDIATSQLWDLGTRGMESRPAPTGRVEWIAYFPPEVDEKGVRAALAGLGGHEVQAVDVPAVDWVARFREGFRGLTAGGFEIAPVWDEAPPGPRLLVVDPGRAFGTGTHESTRLCLGALEALAALGPLGRVLDVGTGTGILAIAARRLGASPVVAADVDPESVVSARRHAQLNGVSLHLLRGDGGQPFRAGAFDLVLANISAPLLVERSDEIGRLLRPGGSLVLAGLLVADLPAVAGAYARWGAHTAREDGEWASLIVRRGAEA